MATAAVQVGCTEGRQCGAAIYLLTGVNAFLDVPEKAAEPVPEIVAETCQYLEARAPTNHIQKDGHKFFRALART